MPAGRESPCLLSLASCLRVYVSDSRWLYYCAPLARHPGQMRAQPWIRCLLTENPLLSHPSSLVLSRLHVLFNGCCPLQAVPQLPSATSGPSLDHGQGAGERGNVPLLEEDPRRGLQVGVVTLASAPIDKTVLIKAMKPHSDHLLSSYQHQFDKYHLPSEHPSV